MLNKDLANKGFRCSLAVDRDLECIRPKVKSSAPKSGGSSAHICSPPTQTAEAGGSLMPRSSSLAYSARKTLSLKTTKKRFCK